MPLLNAYLWIKTRTGRNLCCATSLSLVSHPTTWKSCNQPSAETLQDRSGGAENPPNGIMTILQGKLRLCRACKQHPVLRRRPHWRLVRWSDMICGCCSLGSCHAQWRRQLNLRRQHSSWIVRTLIYRDWIVTVGLWRDLMPYRCTGLQWHNIIPAFSRELYGCVTVRLWQLFDFNRRDVQSSLYLQHWSVNLSPGVSFVPSSRNNITWQEQQGVASKRRLKSRGITRSESITSLLTVNVMTASRQLLWEHLILLL